MKKISCVRTMVGLSVGLGVALLLSATGCATPVPYARFEPRPADVVVSRSASEGEVARALVSVLGARRVGESDRFELQVRIRVESQSDTELEWRADRVRLVTADLRAFGDPRVEPSPVPPIAPGTVCDLELIFPFPPGVRWRDLDLSSLHLTWALATRTDLYSIGTTFQRAQPVRYYGAYYDDPWFDPYWDPYWGPFSPNPWFRTSIGFRYYYRH